MKTVTKWMLTGLGAACAALAARAGAELHRIVRGEIRLPAGFTYTAHSGCAGTPPNSLAYLEKALALGVPVLEVDVTVRNDGTPVLLHAPSAADDAGLPLSQALAFITARSETVRLNLDLKAFSNLSELEQVVAEAGFLNRCFFTGVEPSQSQTVKIDAPHIPYYLNMELNMMRLEDEAYLHSVAAEIKRSGACGLNCRYMYASKTVCRVLHAEGLLVSFWTADNKLVLRNLLTLSPDNITTNVPALLQGLLP